METDQCPVCFLQKQEVAHLKAVKTKEKKIKTSPKIQSKAEFLPLNKRIMFVSL